MSRNGIYVRVLLVVMVLAILVSFLGRASHSEARDAWVPSTFNPVGAGSLAFYETLEQLNWPVGRWREPLSRLDAQGTGNALVITRSRVNLRVAFTDQEADLLDNWVKKGNTLLLFGPMTKWDDTRVLLEQFGFAVPKENEADGFFPAWSLAREKSIAVAPTAGQTGRLVLPDGPALPVTVPQGAKTLWSNGGESYVLELPYGNGRVICVASSELLDNRYLNQGDNLAIVLRLLTPDGQVPRHLFFEEAHHGYTETFAVARLIGHPGVRLAVLLGLLGLATFLGSCFVRFGPVLPLQREPGRSSLEFVDSIAELYHRADLRNETIRFLFDETRRQVLHRLNLPPTAPHELIASRLKQAHPELPGWKKLAQRFDSQDYVSGLPPGGWLRVARELIQIKTALA
jgi:Domain of unknown function (DUF4350)